jgi:hypothetical protein
LPLDAPALLNDCSILGVRDLLMGSGICGVARAWQQISSPFCREGVDRKPITEHIDRKRKDKAFRERLRAVMERDREILERLAR